MARVRVLPGQVAEHAAVVGDDHAAGGAPRRVAAEMLHDRGRHVDPLPAEQAEPAAEVHVFHEHEVRLVEPVDRLERLAPQHLARPGQPAGGRLDQRAALAAVGRRPRVRRPAPAEQGVADPPPQGGKLAGRRVEHAPRVGDRRAEGASARPAFGRRQQLVERPRRERDVGVGHHQPRGGTAGRATVDRRPVAEVAPGAQQADLVAFGGGGGALVQRRRVVHHDDLVGQRRGLGQGVQEGAEHLPGVERHDHHPQVRPRVPGNSALRPAVR